MAPSVFEFDESDLLWREFEEAKRQGDRRPDLVQGLLADLEIPGEAARRFEIESYFADRVDIVRRRLDQTRNELQTRLTLHTAFTEEIDAQIGYCQVSLEKFAGWGVGYNTGVDMKRSNLERQLQQLRSERRRTEVQAWDDVVRLRKELREALQEYRGAQRVSGAIRRSPESQG